MCFGFNGLSNNTIFAKSIDVFLSDILKFWYSLKILKSVGSVVSISLPFKFNVNLCLFLSNTRTT